MKTLNVLLLVFSFLLGISQANAEIVSTDTAINMVPPIIPIVPASQKKSAHPNNPIGTSAHLASSEGQSNKNKALIQKQWVILVEENIASNKPVMADTKEASVKVQLLTPKNEMASSTEATNSAEQLPRPVEQKAVIQSQPPTLSNAQPNSSFVQFIN